MNLDLFNNLNNKMITIYRDKMRIERNIILNNYAKKNSREGAIYYIYSKNSKKENTYNACISGKSNSGKIVNIEEIDLPIGAGVESVLRVKNGKYILDKKATNVIFEEMIELVKKLLKEQEKYLKESRKEGHLYEVIEKSGDIVCLMDKTINSSECFEEIDFSEQSLSNATEGTIFQYIDGKYQLINKEMQV